VPAGEFGEVGAEQAGQFPGAAVVEGGARGGPAGGGHDAGAGGREAGGREGGADDGGEVVR
jgi:hypothetical protein